MAQSVERLILTQVWLDFGSGMIPESWDRDLHPLRLHSVWSLLKILSFSLCPLPLSSSLSKKNKNKKIKKGEQKFRRLV